MADRINYSTTSWLNDFTPLNAKNMNNIEIGVTNLVNFINSLPSWVAQGTKPTYTATEVGADPIGTADNAVLTHNSSTNPHSGVLAKAVHTHTLSQITDFPIASSEKNNYGLIVVDGVWGEKELSDVAFSGDYNDLINRPTIPTATSDLTNDSGYITLNDIRRTYVGSWQGGYITTQRTFNCGFLPDYITITKKTPNGTIIDTTTLNEDYSHGNTEIIFTDSGFTAVSDANGEFNESGYTYSYVAVSLGANGLPLVSSADNGKILAVIGGKWSAAVFTSQLPVVTVEDAGKFLMVNSSGVWAAQSMDTWTGGSY